MSPRVFALTLALSIASLAHATPLTGTFTYQGQLREGGTLVDGNYEIHFRLFDDPAAGTQIGSELAFGLAVTNGTFTQSLNFGTTAFNGERRWLEISLRPLGSADPLTVLAPRREVTSAPNAVYAMKAGTATSATTAANASAFNGQDASFYTNASNLTGTVPDGRLSGTYGQSLTLSSPSNIFFGSGVGLTGLNASNLSTGVIADARLSTNVALKNAGNFFSGTNTFSNNNTFQGNNTFGGNNTFNANNRFNAYVGFGMDPGFPLDVTSASTSITLRAAATGAGTNYAVRAIQRTGANFFAPAGGAAIYGESDTANGVAGFTAATSESSGINGACVSPTGTGRGGTFSSQATFGTGVYALASATTGSPIALRAQVQSASGYAGYFEGGNNYFQGDTGIGTTNPLAKLHVTGSSRVDGTHTVIGNASVSGTATVNGSLNAFGGITVATTTRTRVFDAALWQPLQSTSAYARTAGGGHAVAGSSAGAAIEFQMPLELPQGAILRTITLYYTDNDATRDLTATAIRAIHTNQTSGTTLGTSRVSSSTSASVRTLVWSGLSYAWTPDVESLYIAATWTVPTTTNTIRIGNVVVTYDITSPLP